MCACDTGYSGDGFNCTGIQLILLLIQEFNTVHLHINDRKLKRLPADISSILVKEIKNLY